MSVNQYLVIRILSYFETNIYASLKTLIEIYGEETIMLTIYVVQMAFMLFYYVMKFPLLCCN